MESLSEREKSVITAMTALGRSLGRWPTVREVGERIAIMEGKNVLSVASSFRSLHRKGYLVKDGYGYAIRGQRVKVTKAIIIKE